MESPTITASRSISRRGAKWFRVEISKTGGGGVGEIVTRGLARVFHCGCTQGPWCPGAGVKDIWEDRILGAPGLCRETHGVEVVGELAAHCTFTWTCECQPGMFPARLSALSAGSASPNADRTCPHLIVSPADDGSRGERARSRPTTRSFQRQQV